MKNKRKAVKYAVSGAFLLFFMIWVCLMEIFVEGAGLSDFPEHIRAALDGRGYSLMHLILKLCQFISKRPLITAYVMGGIVLVTVYGIFKYIGRILSDENVRCDKYFIAAVSISGVMLSSIYIPRLYPHFFTASATLTQPWHNSTWLLMRMFGYLTLGAYLYLVKHYCEKGHFIWYAAFTVLLTLTNWSKPNFFLAFAPAMLAVLVYDLFKSSGKQLLSIIKFGVCVLLSMPVLFVQTETVYGDDSGSGIILSGERFRQICTGTEWIWAILCNLLFPIIVTAVMIRVRGKHKELDMSRIVQAWTMYLISCFEMLFIAETGERAAHGNFAWGAYFFAGVLYMTCMAEWTVLYKKKLIAAKSKVFFIGSTVYILNFVSGLLYMLPMMKGYPYHR